MVPEVVDPVIQSESPKIVQEIYRGSLSEPESQRILELRNYYAGEGDIVVYNDIQRLRQEVGTIEGWKQTKEKAREELKQVPGDILEKLLERFSPLIKNLPAGHSRGHFLRDTAYLTAIFQDNEISEHDSVEVFVGMVGGMYHDIGNSVADRYDEAKRFSGHAEIGSDIFGRTATGLLGENLIKMSKLVIAGHTHYLRDRIMTKGEQTRSLKPYDDEVVQGERIAYWWTRQSDRMDAQGPIMDVRHILTKAEPTEDFDGREFHKVWESSGDDFKHQFSTVLRTAEKRVQLESPESTQNVLEHLTMFARSNFNSALPYAKHDNPLYSNLITAAAEEQAEFVQDALSQNINLTPEKREEAFEAFFKLSNMLEPAKNTPATIGLLRDKFKLLSEEDQSKWAHAFKGLVERLYPRMHLRISKVLENKTRQVSDQDEEAKNRVQGIIDNHLHPLALEIWETFSPSKIF